MNKVQAAYQKLGVAPGSSLEATKKRYRQLAMVWHPDRMPTPEGRRTAEEELKQINNAFDCIKKHFESDHRQGPGCECQPSTLNQQTGSGQKQNTGYGHSGGNGHTSGSQANSNPGGYQREKTTYEKWAEQEALAEAERRRREEDEHESALKEALERARQAAQAQAQAQTQAQAAAAAAAKAKAQASTMPMTEGQLRWRVSLALAAIFVFLLIGGFNKRYEPSTRPNSEFSMAEHLRTSPFLSSN